MGASGFLGKRLAQLLEGNNEVSLKKPVGRFIISGDAISISDGAGIDELIDFAPEVIVNMMASWGSVDSEEIMRSNYELPLAIADLFSKSITSWIQIGSYFQYYFEQNGEDYDLYSTLKRLTFEELSINPKLQVLEVRLPMLIGAGSREKGLLSSAANEMLKGQQFRMSSGREWLPVIDVDDAAKTLSEGLFDIVKGPPKRYVEPNYQMTSNHLVIELENALGRRLRRKNTSSLDRERMFLSPVTFTGTPLVSKSKTDLTTTLRGYGSGKD